MLREAGNRRYGKKEKRTSVSLLALRIVNDSADTLRFPEEVFIFSGMDTLWPLYLGEVGEALRQTRSEDGGAVEVETGFLISLLEGIATDAVEDKANQKFGEELDEYYLVFSDILPGTAVVGLVALDVKRGTPFRFFVKK